MKRQISLEESKKSSFIFLSLLCFTLADVRDGLGPFLGIYLQDNNWTADNIGIAMTIGSTAGIVFSSLMGIIADSTNRKRLLLSLLTVTIAVVSFIILVSHNFISVSLSSAVQGIAAAGIAPLLTSITIGLTSSEDMPVRISKNELWNHLGNTVTAAISGILGYYYGIVQVFIVMTVMALLSVLFSMLIKKEHIDYNRARGLQEENHNESVPIKDLLKNRELILIGLTLFFFHFGNAAILPLLGQAANEEFETNSVLYTSLTIIIAQTTMFILAHIASKVINRKSALMIITFIALAILPIRALYAGFFHSPNIITMVIIQVMDGAGAGLIGVSIPVIVAKLLSSSGRINAGIGLTITMQSIGAALSTTYAGIISHRFSYSAAFIALSFMAFIALLIFIYASKSISKEIAEKEL